MLKRLIATIGIFGIVTSVLAVENNVHSTFVPIGTNKGVPEAIHAQANVGVFGQDEKGSWICYGELYRPAEYDAFNTNLGMLCKGESLTLSEMVTKKLNGSLVGATLVYKDPILRKNRNSAWTVSPRNLSEIVLYWTERK